MKKYLPLVALLLSSSSFAAVPKQFKVDMKVYMDGKLVSHPRISLNAGTKGEVAEVNPKTGKGHFIEVTAHAIPDAEDQTFLQLVIGRIEKDGKKVVVGTPQLSAMLKEEAAMEIEEDGRQLFKVAAVVTADQPSRAPAKKAAKKK